jgi:hypothetical protein
METGNIIDQILSSNFDDGWVEGGCIVSQVHQPPKGKLQYTLCASPCEYGMVCNNCIKRPIGKKLKEDTEKMGFDILKYRAYNIELAKKWAINKKKLLDMENNVKIPITSKSSSSEENNEM